jgi:ferrochelatase
LPDFVMTGVLLLAHGTPETVAEVPAFLNSVTRGRPLAPPAVEEIVRRYSLIGRSPLLEWTRKQAQGVERELGAPVYVGMRNWSPSIHDAVAQMAAAGAGRVIAICLAPQNSRTSVGLYRQALQEAVDQLPGEQPAEVIKKLNNPVIGDLTESSSSVARPQVPATSINELSNSPITPSPKSAIACSFVESWHDHPLLIRAFAEKLERGWRAACGAADSEVPVVFTAHSVPQRTIAEGDPYEEQARQTAELVARSVGALARKRWRFAFQSQGMSGGPWLGPTVEDTILALQKEGHQGVFIQPIGFLCDHVEVLYDIDIGFRTFAESRGMQLWRAESLNDSPLLVAALADVARKRLAECGWA